MRVTISFVAGVLLGATAGFIAGVASGRNVWGPGEDGQAACIYCGHPVPDGCDEHEDCVQASMHGTVCDNEIEFRWPKR